MKSPIKVEQKKVHKKDIDNLASAFILEGALNYIMNNLNND